MAEDRESVGCMRNRQCIKYFRRRESGVIGFKGNGHYTNIWFVAHSARDSIKKDLRIAGIMRAEAGLHTQTQ